MPKVSIVKCDSYDREKVLDAARKALEPFELPKNRKVLVKPNALAAKPAQDCITTHPSVVEAVCRILKENGCEITIGDSSGLVEAHGTARALEASGIRKAAEKYGRVIAFEKEGSRTVRNENGQVIKDITIAKPVSDAEYIVNLPKLKTHVLTKYTGAVKNLFGCVPGGVKQRYHLAGKDEGGFSKLLVDIFEAVKPQLTVMDGIIGIEGNGPGAGGKPKKLGVIMASDNAAALDIVASKMIGFEPMEVLTNREAVKRGLVKEDEIKVIGEKVRADFKKPIKKVGLPIGLLSGMFMKLQLAKPVLAKEKCTRCGICAKVCPAKAISLNPYPEFDYEKCIRCYCCHENCSQNAIEIRQSRLYRLAEKVKRKIMGG